jgi:hypothetical protein
MAELTTEVLSLAAIVTAYVGVAKGYGIPAKHNHVIAIGLAALFVLAPDSVKTALVTISLVGLTASGAYHYAKKADK